MRTFPKKFFFYTLHIQVDAARGLADKFDGA